MLNEIDAIKSLVAANAAVEELTAEICKLTGSHILSVRDAIQQRSVQENYNQFAAAQKWLDELKEKQKSVIQGEVKLESQPDNSQRDDLSDFFDVEYEEV